MEIENRKSAIENPSRALFLDRDGTLILDKHYLADPAGVELIPGAAAALARARALGYLLFIVTNQSGIGRGLYTLDDVHRCNVRMDELLLQAAPELAHPSTPVLSPAESKIENQKSKIPAHPIFAGICIAPEAPEQPSLYRKPSPRYILEMIAQHGLDPAQCYMVGDRTSDIQSGLDAHINAVAVCTGKHDATSWAALALPGVPVYPSLAEFVTSLR